MIDFLKQNPYVDREEYMWSWTIPQIRLASYDFTHIEYESEKDVPQKRTDDPDQLMKGLGLVNVDL